MSIAALVERFRPHHQELRERLLKSFIAIALSTAFAYIFKNDLAAFCTQPLFSAAPTL
ncbi:MAG: twin-arginine translocase subunit TatC, partial [Candidatus Electrothrix sp. ATG2]|nr:twin-arginine translocase subunit TatC [Candidatus Electrothrix sp. ATG2]